MHAIEVAVAFSESGALSLRYALQGDPAGLRLPEPCPPAAADCLWQHTCCEVFMAAGDAPAYREFNFSPSGQWAAYGFVDYRQRDNGFQLPLAPQISLRRRADACELLAVLAPEALPAGPNLRLGLSVVLEAADGSKSYWALGHAAAQPDFHLRQSFSLPLKVSPP